MEKQMNIIMTMAAEELFRQRTLCLLWRVCCALLGSHHRIGAFDSNFFGSSARQRAMSIEKTCTREMFMKDSGRPRQRFDFVWLNFRFLK